MRTFIAIELSEEIRSALGQVQSHLKYAGADVKWVNPQNIHLTLKFLGEVDEKKLEKVKTALDGVAASSRAFELSLKEIGAFPAVDHPRVVWVGLDKGSDESKALAQNIDESLSKIGFQKETRPFAAHVTIGRVRSPHNKLALKEKIISYNTNDERRTTSDERVSSITLFKSALTPQGPVYTVLHESKLCTV
jgi:2'-5' RNA ligase